MWKDYRFEIMVGLSICFLLLGGLIFWIIGKKGTWDKERRYYLSTQNQAIKKKRGPPRESKGELECKRVLENLFQRPFNKIRPDFLRNPVTGNEYNLEIDCYNSELKLGIEYNGKQHYYYVPYFHKNKEAFLNQKYRDLIKQNMCKDNDICLIEVPYTVSVNNIENYLRNQLIDKGFNI